MNVWAIVLAAGAGRRMGGDKLTLPYGGHTIIESIVRTALAAPVQGVTVVLGHHADRVRDALSALEVSFAVNQSPEAGMLSSVKCGIRAMPSHVDAFLIVLGDQPEMRQETIHALIDAPTRSDRTMFIPEFGGKRGHPVLFHVDARESILDLPSDTGLNAWREAHAEDVELVPIGAEHVLRDVDTPEDYRAALERLETQI